MKVGREHVPRLEDRLRDIPRIRANPDQMGPIVRNTADGTGTPLPALRDRKSRQSKSGEADGQREAGRPQRLIRLEADRGTTNVRKLTFPHWKRWFGVEHRCIVPVTSFAEPDPKSQEEGGKVPNVWFAADENKPLMFFAGIHVPQWQSVRKVKDGLTTDDLYGSLTTDPNGQVKPIHEKAMPALLLAPEEVNVWMQAPEVRGTGRATRSVVA